MVQREAHGERTERSSPVNPMPGEFAAMGKKRLEELANAQREFLDKLQETNRQWFDRAQAEPRLASEFAAKLTAARTMPEAVAACQEWATRRFEMMAEDGKRLMADTQAFMEAGVRLLSNGSSLNGGGGFGT